MGLFSKNKNNKETYRSEVNPKKFLEAFTSAKEAYIVAIPGVKKPYLWQDENDTTIFTYIFLDETVARACAEAHKKIGLDLVVLRIQADEMTIREHKFIGVHFYRYGYLEVRAAAQKKVYIDEIPLTDQSELFYNTDLTTACYFYAQALKHWTIGGKIVPEGIGPVNSYYRHLLDCFSTNPQLLFQLGTNPDGTQFFYSAKLSDGKTAPVLYTNKFELAYDRRGSSEILTINSNKLSELFTDAEKICLNLGSWSVIVEISVIEKVIAAANNLPK